MNNHPYYYGARPIPQQYQQPQAGGNSIQNLLPLLAYISAMRSEGGEQPVDTGMPSLRDTYQANIGLNPPAPAGLSPLGRFNDMVLRQSAALSSRTADGRAAVEGKKQEQSDNQRLVDSITHPAPTAPYSISPTMSPTGAPNAVLSSRYGTGSVSFAPPGTDIHGKFGPEGLQFGQIGGAGEAQPTSGDPMQTTFQQDMIMDSINKALGKKKGKA